MQVMRGLVMALLLSTVLLAGCANEGPATFRFKGKLDRALTAEEQQEVRDVAGDFQVESTLVYCTPDVDPYDCNSYWLRVDDITQARCNKAVNRLQGRTYWRTGPTCDQPPDDGV
jgi:hypothetical protein